MTSKETTIKQDHFKDQFDYVRKEDWEFDKNTTDFIKQEAKFLYDYVNKRNIYNLKVVKEIIEGMLFDINHRLDWLEHRKEN